MTQINQLYLKMIEYYKGDPKRIQHFTKVHSYAKLIGESEKLDEKMQLTLEAAALVHDIGIKPAEAKFGKCSGKLQEQEGGAPAEKILLELSFEKDIINRVVYLVTHHHSYNQINGIDYQILVEADFLVNLYEENLPFVAVETACAKIFKTNSGKALCQTMFNI